MGEMIRAALPGMEAKVHEVVSVTPPGRAAFEAGSAALLEASLPAVAFDPPARDILCYLAGISVSGGTAVRLADLKRRLGPRFRPAALSRLRTAGLVEVTEVAAGPGPRPRLQSIASRSGAGGAPPRGQRQREILRLLDAPLDAEETATQ